MEQLPLPANVRSDYANYIVDEIERLSNVMVHFQVCHHFSDAEERAHVFSLSILLFSTFLTSCQLDLAILEGMTRGFRVWDTPCPPPLAYNGGHNDSFICHLGTVGTEAGSLTGITFFVSYGSFYAVHAHTRAQPSAEYTYLNLQPYKRDKVAWVYVPIRKGIEEFAFTQARDLGPGHSKKQQVLVRGDKKA